jgi:hypothetical protein
VRVASSSSIDGNRQAPFLKIADFSSAIDETALRNGLYGVNGPSQNENTIEYAPPEVLFSKDKVCLHCYDTAYSQYRRNVGIPKTPAYLSYMYRWIHACRNLAVCCITLLFYARS